RAAGEVARSPLTLLEGASVAAGALPSGYRDQGREQPGSHWNLRTQPQRSGVSGRKAGGFIADPGRRDEYRIFAANWQRQFHHQQYVRAAAGVREPDHAGEPEAQPGLELLAAVL